VFLNPVFPAVSSELRKLYLTCEKFIRGITAMARFIVRVELHGASEAHYLKLHELMAARGLQRFIDSASGGNCWLPPAEYNILTNLSPPDVRNLARACAGALGLRYALLVTEANSVLWDGLQAA
jgi:hypothetical protein